MFNIRWKECVQVSWEWSHKLYLQNTTLPDLIKGHYSCLISAVVKFSILFISVLLILFNLVALNPGPGRPQHCTFSSGHSHFSPTSENAYFTIVQYVNNSILCDCYVQIVIILCTCCIASLKLCHDPKLFLHRAENQHHGEHPTLSVGQKGRQILTRGSQDLGELLSKTGGLHFPACFDLLFLSLPPPSLC